jgi:hypothetical protein
MSAPKPKVRRNGATWDVTYRGIPYGHIWGTDRRAWQAALRYALRVAGEARR